MRRIFYRFNILFSTLFISSALCAYEYNIPSAQEVMKWLKDYKGELIKVDAAEGKPEVYFPDMGEHFLHPQGMIKIGEEFFLSSVDPRGRRNSDSTKENGFLHKFILNDDGEIEIIQDLEAFSFEVQGGAMSEHHPGGMDFELSSSKIIIPVAQYKPDSTTTFILVDPDDIENYERAVRVDDHIGAVVCGPLGGEDCVLMFNWDSKDVYRLKSYNLLQSGLMKVLDRRETIDRPWAYQDCKSLGSLGEEDALYALCTATKPRYAFVLMKYTVDGGAQEVARTNAPKVGGFLGFGSKAMSQNPMTFEKVLTASGYKIRFYFMPHDGEDLRLFVYETPVMAD